MIARRSIKRALILVAILALLIPMSMAGTHKAAAAAAESKPRPPGKAWHHRKWHPPQAGQSPLANGAQSPAVAAEMVAATRARASGKAVVAGSLTTPTSLVTAEPNGMLTGSASVLPVRVRTATGWVPVNTKLRFTAGRWAPVAVPGDSVSFSAGGTGPAVEISTGHSSVRLWWARRLPAPSVSGSSAVYKNALPGVNLVLTATSRDTGGYSAVLVVTSRAAASRPGVVRPMWRVSAPGTLGLRTLRDGGLAAAANSLRGYFGAAPPAMWDSSSLRLNAAKSAIRGAEQAAFAAGAGLAGDGMGAVSSAAGPAGGARLAKVTARVAASGQTLSLAPDTRLLTSSSTRFPVFIAAAGFYYHDVTANEQAYDPVQSDNGNEGCGSDTGICDTGVSCTGSHYDSSSYSFSPVGYDNFGAPPPNNNCQFNDTDYALYRVGIPGGSLGSNAVIANSSFQIKEVYSSSCSGTATMTATWIGAIGQSTGWPGPGASPGNKDATQSLGPDPNSCDQTEDTSQVVPAGFNVTSDLNMISDSATTITFRVWESGSPSDTLHKQLTDNPTLEVQWVDKPDMPKSLEESSNSDTTGNTYDCSSTAAGAPHIGKTDSLNGPYLDAIYSDVNGISVQADIEYKTQSASTWTQVIPANVSVASGSEYGFHLPASVTSKLTDGTVMEWAAQAETGKGTIGTGTFGPYKSDFNLKPCYFAVYPTSPNPPSLVPNFTATTPQTVGGPDVKFTITEASGDTASKFVWGLDQMPPTSNPPAAQICSSIATSSCTALAKNSGGHLFATLSIPVVAPGPHDVWVYEIDTGNNDSGTVNGAPKGQTSTFSGAGDPMVQYVSQSSLELNFQAAVAAGKSVMISTQAGLPGNANADGNGNSFDSAQMTAAGWDSGKTVTVDGATFALPSFGTTNDKGDNLLSAAQRIGTGGGAQGSALVFLATSTHGVVPVPGVTGTGSVDSTPLNLDFTAPMVEAGYQVTGKACSYEVLFNNTASCTAATGEINYAAGCKTATNNQQQYTLTVPDWVTGPADIAALEMPDRDHPGAQQASNPNIYVFAVPVNPSCTVMSVDLPDVGPSIYAPALHILGMTFRNTTTATPEVGGTMAPSPSGQAWTGAFASDIDNADGPPSGQTWGSQTVRIALSPGVSVPAGASLRIRLSDPGFFSEDGSGAQDIGAASIALQQSGPTAQATPIPLTFGNGSSTATVPEGGDVYSDPTQPLPFAIAPNQNLLVSLYLGNQSISVLPLNDNPSGATSWFTAAGTNNQTGVQSGSAFTVTGSTYAANIVPLLTGVDVTTPEVTTTTPNTPGEPTVVVTGDGGIVDNNIATIPSDALNSPSQRLAGQLAGQLVSQGNTPPMGVVDASVPSNSIFQDTFTTSIGIPPTGIEFEERVDHDILAEPDVGTVVINEGLEDVLIQDGSTVGPVNVMTTLTNFLGSVQGQLFAFGVPSGGIVFGSQTPCWGYSNGYNCDSSADTGRLQINQTLGDLGGNCPSNFNGAVEQPGSNPNALASAYDTGDHANLTLGANGGYAALAAMEYLTCGVAIPLYAFPPSTG